jgi:uncharacterized protein (TIGR00369 family)
MTALPLDPPAHRLARLVRDYDGLDFLDAIRTGELPPPPIADLLGFEPRDLDPGRVTFTFRPAEQHYNPLGMVHGGVSATLLDTVMGCAVHSVLPKGAGYSTLDISVRYLRPVTVETGPVLATGTLVHRGRRVATAEGRLVDTAQGRILATSTSTLLVFES